MRAEEVGRAGLWLAVACLVALVSFAAGVEIGDWIVRGIGSGS